MSTPRELVELFARLGEKIAAKPTTDDALAAITQVAVDVVVGAHFASITRDRGDHFQTLAPTAAVATDADRLQYEIANGPCVEAASRGGLVVSDDVALDPRWGSYGPEVATTFGVSSMLAVGMVFETDVRAGLNIYSRDRACFDDTAQATAMLLATHGALAVSRVVERQRADNLETALITSRQIGTAMGILMSERKVTAEQAFTLLRIASQNTNRRVAAVAEDIIATGELSLPQ